MPRQVCESNQPIPETDTLQIANTARLNENRLKDGVGMAQANADVLHERSARVGSMQTRSFAFHPHRQPPSAPRASAPAAARHAAARTGT